MRIYYSRSAGADVGCSEAKTTKRRKPQKGARNGLQETRSSREERSKAVVRGRMPTENSYKPALLFSEYKVLVWSVELSDRTYPTGSPRASVRGEPYFYQSSRKRVQAMSKFRFAGTLKEIEVSSSSMVLYFAPDQEYLSSFKVDKDKTTKYAIIQPVDKDKVGYAFEFDGTVKLECDTKSAHMNVGAHYLLSLTTDVGKGIIDVVFKDIPDTATLPSIKKRFAIESIRAL